MPLTADQLAGTLDALLARQHADAAAKDKDSWQWGSTGSLVRRAARDCERILLPVPAADEVAGYFQRVLPLLSALADRYRNDDDDADGYGLGTVREIEEAMLVLSRQ